MTLEQFSEAMREKMERRARENNRPLEPWKHFEADNLRGRLLEEVREWQYAKPSEKADELLDIANFCWFLWEQSRLKGRKP